MYNKSMSIKEKLLKELEQIIKNFGGDFIPSIEFASDLKHGDLTTNAAMILAKTLKKNPIEIAEEIAIELRSKNYELREIDTIEIVKPGFINFRLSKEYLGEQLGQLFNNNIFPTPSSSGGHKIMVEFAHPNTHKSLHIGHIRNIATAESIIRLLNAVGISVIRANYQGDVGMHIAKAMYGLLDLEPFKNQLNEIEDTIERVAFLGKAYAAGSSAYESDEAAKKTIHDYNYLIYASAQKFQEENGNSIKTADFLNLAKDKKELFDKVYEVWKETRQWSLDYYEEMYRRLGAHFDRYYFESECGKALEIARGAVDKGILEKSDGAIVFKGEKYGLDTRVFVNSLGLPTYEAKELALAEKEFSEFGNLDKVIHVVGPEQASFFKVTFKVEELLNPDLYAGKQRHLAYGWVRLKQGKMSSRMGNVVTAIELIEVTKKEISAVMDKSEFAPEEKESVIEATAIGAIKYSFLKVSTNQEIAFDIQESISFDGNSGPYLQYTYARTQSVLRKAKSPQPPFLKGEDAVEPLFVKEDDLTEPPLLKGVPKAGDLQPEELDLLRLLFRFEDTVKNSAEKFAPNILCNYLFELAQAFNLFYQKLPILKAEGESREVRLALTAATGNVIKKGLYLLGIDAPERM